MNELFQLSDSDKISPAIVILNILAAIINRDKPGLLNLQLYFWLIFAIVIWVNAG